MSLTEEGRNSFTKSLVFKTVCIGAAAAVSGYLLYRIYQAQSLPDSIPQRPPPASVVEEKEQDEQFQIPLSQGPKPKPVPRWKQQHSMIDVSRSDDRFKGFPGLAISTCDLSVHPVHGVNVMPGMEFCEILPVGLYAVRGYYTWDTWVCDSRNIDNRIHRYTLTAATMRDGTQITPDERHDLAYVRHAYSENEGKDWEDTGACIIPNQEKWPNKVIWSGCCIVREYQGRPQFAMFVTGRSEEDGLMQRIGVCFSDDGQKFSKPHLILSPPTNYEQSYDHTDDDGVIMAWRDPSVTLDPVDGTYHLFFSAKLKDGEGNTIPTIGHATPKDDDWMDWNLEAPMELPVKYAQVEMPYIITKHDHYFLFVSTQDNPLESSNLDKKAAYRAYKSPNLLGPWREVFCTEDYCLLEGDEVFGSKVYAPTIYRTHDGEYGVTAFYSEDTKYPLTCTPLLPMNWDPIMDPPVPRIAFEDLPGLTPDE